MSNVFIFAPSGCHESARCRRQCLRDTAMASRSDNIRGAAVAVASLGAFACNDAIVKHVMLTLPEVQAVFLRGLLAVPLLSALSAYRRELFTPAAPRDRRLIALRCVVDVSNTFSFLAAIHRGPMADVAVVLAVQPLLVMLGARVLGERIEPAQWALAFVGLLGVGIVSRPGGNGVGARGSSILFAAACAVLGSIRDLLARRLGRRVPSTQVATLSAAAVTVSAGVASLPQIVSSSLQPTPRELVLLSAASLFVAAALVGSVLQMRLGATGFVQPFRYSFILWAMLLDIALFNDWPDSWTLLGACIVVGCGVASLSREQRRQGGAAAAAQQHATRESSPPLVEVNDVASELSEEEPRVRDSVDAALVDSGPIGKG